MLVRLGRFLVTGTPPPAPKVARPPKRVEEGLGALPSLTIAALGVVFGDLSTSPLYTASAVFQARTTEARFSCPPAAQADHPRHAVLA